MKKNFFHYLLIISWFLLLIKSFLKNKIGNPEELKGFSWEGFEFDESLSDEKKLVFINGMGE